MNKLLRADFWRLFKDLVFRLSLVAAFLAGLASALMRHISNIQYNGAYTTHLEDSFLPLAIFMLLVCTAFTSLFIGTEYSEGPIRNKVIAGHRRSFICLSELVCVLAGTLMIAAAFLLPYYAVGLPTVGFSENGNRGIVEFTAVFLALLCAFTALFSMLCHIIRSKAYSAVCCILLAIALTAAGVWVGGKLSEPEYYSTYLSYSDGTILESRGVKNPDYVDGTIRDVLEFLYDFSSGGQLSQLDGFSAKGAGKLIAYDLVIVVLTAFGTVEILKKRDLN